MEQSRPLLILEIDTEKLQSAIDRRKVDEITDRPEQTYIWKGTLKR
jgi:hypothetical protein